MKLWATFATLFSLTLHLTANCASPSQLTNPNIIGIDPQMCPVNSHCLENGLCECDLGFVGGCTQAAYRMENGVAISAAISNDDYTFFEVIGNTQVLTLLSFNLCLDDSNNQELYLDVWDDDGTLDQLKKQNAQIGGKSWRLDESCLTLNTPFMLFGTKQNGQRQGFILGLKKVQTGTAAIKFKVNIIQLNFWDIFAKIMFTLGCCFLLVLSAVLTYIVYKWKRRRFLLARQVRDQDTSHMDTYMPKIKLQGSDKIGLASELCSICLLELGGGQYLRKTVCCHVFHQDCLDSWCKNHLSCPVCRRSFQLEDLKGDFATFQQTDSSNLRQVIL